MRQFDFDSIQLRYSLRFLWPKSHTSGPCLGMSKWYKMAQPWCYSLNQSDGNSNCLWRCMSDIWWHSSEKFGGAAPSPIMVQISVLLFSIVRHSWGHLWNVLRLHFSNFKRNWVGCDPQKHYRLRYAYLMALCSEKLAMNTKFGTSAPCLMYNLKPNATGSQQHDERSVGSTVWHLVAGLGKITS